MTHRDLTIIITTFKSEQKIRECLSSIDPKINIILIENSSSIEFKKNIESNFSNVTCELTNDNLGYGKANNTGLKKVKTKYALILNPDTVLSSNTLELFFEFTKTNKDFTILGPNQNEKISTLYNHKKLLLVNLVLAPSRCHRLFLRYHFNTAIHWYSLTLNDSRNSDKNTKPAWALERN